MQVSSELVTGLVVTSLYLDTIPGPRLYICTEQLYTRTLSYSFQPGGQDPRYFQSAVKRVIGAIFLAIVEIARVGTMQYSSKSMILTTT